MQKIKQRAFTLVELIVVITILAILWTIAFISLQWYSRDARDATRTTDLWNIKTSIELYSIQTWKDPLPDNYSIITYSGWTENVWYQWVVWDKVTINLKSLNEKPLDPLTNDPYVYSTTNTYKEYEVLALYEWSVVYNSVINTVNAAITSLTPKIAWNYNWVFVKTNNYIIPTPSIVIAESLLTWTPLELTTSNIKSLVITNGTNIPKNTLTQEQTGALNINLSVYTWSINNNSTDNQKVIAMKIIQQAYSWTSLSNKYTYVLKNTSTWKLVTLANNLILWSFKSLPYTNTNNTNPVPVNWICWTSNWLNITSIPTTNLCNAWNSTSVLDNWAWSTYSWSCNWVNWWTNTSCIANNTNPVNWVWTIRGVIPALVQTCPINISIGGTCSPIWTSCAAEWALWWWASYDIICQ